jgi:hypothetical protein
VSLDHARIDAECRTKPFQFSLRTMFILTTVVAIVCGGMFAPWDWLQYLTLFFLGVTIPMTIVVALIYSRGYARTFWIGAIFPAGVILLFDVIEGSPLALFTRSVSGGAYSGGTYNDPFLVRLMIGVSIFAAIVMILLSGLIAVGVRWMVESSRQERKPLAPAGRSPLLPEFIEPTASEESQSDAG